MAILIPNFELAEKIGSRVEIEASNVDELVRKGIAQFGEPFKKTLQTASIVVNGRNVSLLKGGKTKLSHDDNVWLILPSGGG